MGRRSVYLVLAVIVGLGAYLNQVGIPESLKNRLLETLRQRGVAMEFERIRFRATRGIVAEQVTLGRLGDLGGEQFSAQEVQLALDWGQVLALKPEVRGLKIRGGAVSIPLVESNRVASHFNLHGVEARIRFEGAEKDRGVAARRALCSCSAPATLQPPPSRSSFSIPRLSQL
jgi:hypothetical protein